MCLSVCLFVSQNLHDALEYDKNQTLQSLEDRLMRKKLARKRDRSAASSEAVTWDGKILTDEHMRTLLAEEQEIEINIAAAIDKYNQLQEGLCTGYKKRFGVEIKATMVKGAPLTDEERDKCHRQAADTLKVKVYQFL